MKKIIEIIVFVASLPFGILGFIYQFAKGSFYAGMDASDNLFDKIFEDDV